MTEYLSAPFDDIPLPSQRHIPWKRKTSEEISAIIQEYADPNTDTQLTKWSAKRLIGALLRHKVEKGLNPMEDVQSNIAGRIRRGELTPAPVRLTFKKVANEQITYSTEINHVIIEKTPISVLRDAQFFGSALRVVFELYPKGRLYDEVSLVKNEVLLSGDLQFEGQKQPRWIELAPDEYICDHFRREF